MRISPTLLVAAVFAASLGLAACGNNSNGNSANGHTAAGNDNQTAGQQAQNTGQQMQNQANNAANSAKVGASDTAITAAVKSKLLANSSTSGMDIHVETNHGVVTLSGTVRSDAEKTLAERIARNTDGVTDVTNNLKVQGG
ncbi:MAG TPA: BON domain-containing protein [Gammaproteobacteria bacterium]|nr:BON domain-containing protein [Gammaproteobacteria bacterium]